MNKLETIHAIAFAPSLDPKDALKSIRKIFNSEPKQDPPMPQTREISAPPAMNLSDNFDAEG